LDFFRFDETVTSAVNGQSFSIPLTCNLIVVDTAESPHKEHKIIITIFFDHAVADIFDSGARSISGSVIFSIAAFSSAVSRKPAHPAHGSKL